MRVYGLAPRAWDFAGDDSTMVPDKVSRARANRLADRQLVRDLDAEYDADWLLGLGARCGDPSCGDRCNYFDDPWFVSDEIGIVTPLRRDAQPLTFRLQAVA